MEEENAKAQLMSRIALAEKEIASESWGSYDDLAGELRREYDLGDTTPAT